MSPLVRKPRKKLSPLSFLAHYLQGMFKRHNFDLDFSNKLSDVLGNSGNKYSPLEKSGVYKIACEGTCTLTLKWSPWIIIVVDFEVN
jgi:hypothetical protein